jgi:hypothetical protein
MKIVFPVPRRISLHLVSQQYDRYEWMTYECCHLQRIALYDSVLSAQLSKDQMFCAPGKGLGALCRSKHICERFPWLLGYLTVLQKYNLQFCGIDSLPVIRVSLRNMTKACVTNPNGKFESSTYAVYCKLNCAQRVVRRIPSSIITCWKKP